MFWIALVASMTAPEPRYMWLSNDDTPTNELGDHDAVETRLRLTIATDGRVHACAIEQTSGNTHIDQYTCDLARRRALFRPAQSADGAPMFGIYRVPVIWAAVPM